LILFLVVKMKISYFFFDGQKVIFEVGKFDGLFKKGISNDFMAEIEGIEEVGFDLSFYWANWG
jgi:hypothetical protein